MGVAEAWVLGGDQGQLGQAGKKQIVDCKLYLFADNPKCKMHIS